MVGFKSTASLSTRIQDMLSGLAGCYFLQQRCQSQKRFSKQQKSSLAALDTGQRVVGQTAWFLSCLQGRV